MTVEPSGAGYQGYQAAHEGVDLLDETCDSTCVGWATLGNLGQFTMYRFSTRHFPGIGLKGVVTHEVDAAGVNSVRWAELDLPSLAGAQVADTGTSTSPTASIAGSAQRR